MEMAFEKVNLEQSAHIAMCRLSSQIDLLKMRQIVAGVICRVRNG